MIILLEMTDAVEASSEAISVSEELTSTDTSTEPGFSSKFCEMCTPAFRTRPACLTAPNPGAEAVTVYGPGNSSGRTYTPAPLEIVV